MKKNASILGICLGLSIALLAGCSSAPAGDAAQTTTIAEETATTVAEETATTEAAPLDEETIKLSTITLNDATITLPLSYQEFEKATGFGFKNNTAEYTEETRIPAYTTLCMTYDIENGGMLVLVANQTGEEIAAKDGNVIAVKATLFQKGGSDLKIDYCGLNWESPHTDILDKFGESESAETHGKYYLSGYSKMRDDASNVSYSFVSDDTCIYSIALSIDDMAITYGSLEAEATTEAETE